MHIASMYLYTIYPRCWVIGNQKCHSRTTPTFLARVERYHRDLKHIRLFDLCVCLWLHNAVETNTQNIVIKTISFKLFAVTCCPDCVEFQAGSNRATISARDEA
jgi:hypothetical protein